MLRFAVLLAAEEEIPYQPTRDTGIKVLKIRSSSSRCLIFFEKCIAP